LLLKPFQCIVDHIDNDDLTSLDSDAQQTCSVLGVKADPRLRPRWPAWARADQSVRQLLGIPDAPVLLAEVSRHCMIPIQTLAKTALEERLPTIRVGDRQLIYLTTIAEAQQRRRLHHTLGSEPTVIARTFYYCLHKK